jgi:glycosyltransferase involved in cell wall biosynthesis
MTQLPTISIITVSYNAEKTIERTIQSVLNQHYQGKLEYIIIDGGSTDHTVDIIRSYEQDNIKWTSEEDEGIYDAMNKGIQMATGDWIGILNSDDWYAKNALNIVGRYSIKNPDVDFLIGKMIRVSGNMQFGKIVDPPKRKINVLKPNNHPATFVSKKGYQNLGLFDTSYSIAADLDFIIRASKCQTVSIGICNNVLTYMKEGGVSNGLSGLKESYVIEKKYWGNKAAALAFFKKGISKVRKELTQRILPKSISLFLQKKWWHKNYQMIQIPRDNMLNDS